MSKPKPRGRTQDRPSKDRIVHVLELTTMATTREIAGRVNLSPRCARQHLYGLEDSGEVARIEEEGHHTVWCLPENVEQARALVLAQATRWIIPRAHVSNTAHARINPQTEALQIHRPAGQWRADHGSLARSVFELGVA